MSTPQSLQYLLSKLEMWIALWEMEDFFSFSVYPFNHTSNPYIHIAVKISQVIIFLDYSSNLKRQQIMLCTAISLSEWIGFKAQLCPSILTVWAAERKWDWGGCLLQWTCLLFLLCLAQPLLKVLLHNRAGVHLYSLLNRRQNNAYLQGGNLIK